MTAAKIKRQAKALIAADKAKAAIGMRQALGDKALLGSILSGDSWHAWRVLLTAIMGEALTEDERAIFSALTGREHEPREPCEEFWAVIGRRGGKSRAMAVLAAFLAAFRDYKDVTAIGEKPTVLVMAQNVRQAGILLSYIAGIFESVPLLAAMVKNRTQEGIELSNNVTIEVGPANFRGIRGITCVAVICDEQAFWYDESSGSANPDSEILAALRPALATTGGPLICISSPYSRRGELWLTFDRHFGAKGDPKILVARAPSRTMNPSLPQRVVDRAFERDASAASAEFLAEFRSDLERFLTVEAVRAVVLPSVVELPPRRHQTPTAFVDAAGGSGSDSMTLALAYADAEGAVLAALRERKPPFSPQEVVGEFCALLKTFGVTEVRGDRWGGEFVAEQFEARGIRYRPADLSRSEIYLELLPMINSRKVALLDDKRLISQLVQLERRTSRAGKESVDHGPSSGAHDDIANYAAGSLVYATRRSKRPVLHFG